MSAFAERALIGVVAPDPYLRGTSSSQSPLYSGRLSVGIRNVATLLLLSPPNPLRWALAGPPIKPVVLLTSGALAPTKRKFKVCALYGHRLLWQNRGSWAVAGGICPTTAAPQGGTPEAKRSVAESSFAYFSYKKSRRSRPRIGTRAPKKTLRGATQFQNRATPFPFAPVLRQGRPRPSPSPLVAPSSSGPFP